MKKNKILGITFLILSLISFFALFLILGNFEIPLFNSVNADIRLNFETKESVKVYINGFEIKELPNSENNSYKTFGIDNFPVYKISYSGKNVDNIVLSVGHNLYCFDKKNIQNFKKDKNKNFVISDVKYYKNSKYITDKGFLHKFFINFLAIFYNPFYFIVPIFFLIMALLNLNFTMSKNSAILWILSIALILRLSDLTPLYWTDELYTVYMAGNPNMPFSSALTDAGNPPLFFILAKIWMKLFGILPETARLLPCIFSILSVFFIYSFLKDEDKNAGLLSAFLLTINIYSLVSAKELRSYSLCILCSILLSIYLFKLFKNPSCKNFTVYFLICAASFNTHYFMSLLIFSNFIFGLTFIKDRIKFICANIFAFLTFVPFLLINGIKNGLLDKNFNNMPSPNLNFYVGVLSKFTGFILAIALIFALILIIKFKNKILKDNKLLNIFYYSFYSVISIFILSYAFSFIKPICAEYYFIILLPFFIVLVSSFCFLSYKNKKLQILVSILLLIFYFLPHKYIQRDKTRLLIFDSIVSFYNFNKEKDSLLIIPHSEKMLIKVYNLSKDEICVNSPPQKVNNLINIINSSEKNSFYFKLEHKNLPEFTEKTKNYSVAYIRIDKDAIIARIKKK